MSVEKVGTIGLGAVVIAVSLYLANSASAAPVAMVTDIQGKGKVVSQSETGDLALLSQLVVGDEVRLDDASRLIMVYLDSADEFDIAGPATFRVASNQPEILSGAEPTRRRLGISGDNDVRISPVNATQASIVMRAGDSAAALNLVSPVDTAIIDPHPVFRWEAVEGVTQYEFRLDDDSGNTLVSEDVSGNAFESPAEVTLVEGVTYTLEVSARLPSRQQLSNWADFNLLGATAKRKINDFRPGEGASVSERVVYASVLEGLGARDAAREIWTELLAERGGDDPVLRQLIRP